MEKFYITTAIDYVNAPPHIGHAYEKIATDVLARHFRQRGIPVFFLTGSDEHGIKIERTSKEKGLTPLEFCDEIAQKFKEAWELLDIKYDRYIRTTEADHKKVVQHIFKTLVEKGDIYKAAYTGIYCAGCESFLNERDLTEDGLCPDHKTKLQEVKEENYFFKLSKYKEKIIEHIKTNPRFVLPEFRVNELLNQLKDMEDFSVSRSKEAVSWGIPVPDDDAQIIYVWIDALSNYLTGIGYLKDEALFDKFWSANVHMIGKDILKFHSIYWIAILMALKEVEEKITLPETIFAHGWITVDQTKMSKTLGNVIAPKAVLDAYNLDKPDALRYFLMTTTPFGRDGNYSDEDFKNKVNADLANNLGNLLNRTLSMLIKYFDGEIKLEHITESESNLLAELTENRQKIIVQNFYIYEISNAAETIIKLADTANEYLQNKKPWSLAKEGKMIECGQVLYNVLETLRHISIMIYPFTPNIAQDMWIQLGQPDNIEDVKYAEIPEVEDWVEEEHEHEIVGASTKRFYTPIKEKNHSKLEWGGLQAGKIASVETVKPVFLRLDSEIAGEDKKRNK